MSGRFVSRPILPVGVFQVAGWKLKRYEITIDGSRVAPAINNAVDLVLASELPSPDPGQLGVGFLIIHHGAESVWILADLWNDDIVSQHTFFAGLDNPNVFARVPAGGPTACVWELPVHAHERDALVSHVLNPEVGPDIDAYLADTLDTADRTETVAAS